MEIKTKAEKPKAETYVVATGATHEEYLELEERSELRHELYKGRITAMAGGTDRHNLIGGSIQAYMKFRLRRSGCRVFIEGMRLQIRDKTDYTYPDVFIVCGASASGTITSAVNPVAVFEVLSKKTRDKDRGEKFERYGQIAALRHYVLVDQYKAEVEHRRRTDGDQWTTEVLTSLDETLQLDAIPVEITLNEIYEDISFD